MLEKVVPNRWSWLTTHGERELSKRACFLWYSLVTSDSWHIELNVTNFRIICKIIAVKVFQLKQLKRRKLKKFRLERKSNP